MAFSKSARRNKIRKRIRKTIVGTASRPRLSVFRSNKEIYAQLINDEDGVTIASASSRELEKSLSKSEAASEVGKMVAKKAKDSGIETVSFDRGGYLYHGRVLSLAQGAREGGLNF
ncbi:LSU ribosomal protein L18P [Nonlabens dokdonensis]|jgi:large subunit ribosomal protein L18|uniref:Large ribosomal subunit protein uL18 n=2 Tax=Nonlabens dokdonensis TaxID=328515 RepID=L7W9U4_NONDD|nr:50S ribosomal protein L18 [Nonlabens dokdonensis]AGC75653.1 putative 50S ribosomal protein L18 [Nonlabens dokdonensis DSW-6]PZX43342.1 LSU ribosomal protein L18P [Nonlabens dokdonensis]